MTLTVLRRLFVFALLTHSAMLSAQSDADGAAVAAATGLPSATGAPQPGWRNQWGVGVIANPASVGGDDYNITPVPYVDFRYFDEKGSLFFANVPQGIGGYGYRYRDAPSGRFFNIGAAIAPGFNVRDDSRQGFDEVGIATEARLLIETGGRRWALNAVLAQDVGSGHEGAYLDLNLAWRNRLPSARGFYAVGPVVRIGDATYKGALFNVSAAESSDSGLPVYRSDAGIERVGLQGLLSMPVAQSKWRLTTVLRASQLVGDAADSPLIVDEAQLFFIASLTRPF